MMKPIAICKLPTQQIYRTAGATMTSPVRLAVLECDNLIKTRKEYGGYCGVYTTLLHAAADNLGIPHDRLAISKYDVINEMRYPSLDEVDAMLISGSSM